MHPSPVHTLQHPRPLSRNGAQEEPVSRAQRERRQDALGRPIGTRATDHSSEGCAVINQEPVIGLRSKDVTVIH